jgi:CelD/BcsL family acetyltransferase involved in cellulose biosynthesis
MQNSSRPAAAIYSPGASPRLSVELSLNSLPPLLELEHDWRDLESRSDGSFFVSWSWLGCWLHSLDGAVKVSLLRATLGGCTIGLALLAHTREVRHGIIMSRRLRLHDTGQLESDGLHVECNGFLVDRQFGAQASDGMLQHLLTAEPGWDEVVMDGVSRPLAWSLTDPGAVRRTVTTRANHFVDLSEVRAKNGDYLSLLGAKTRSHIRRSRKEYKVLGDICVNAATDISGALTYFEGLKYLHQSYWTARGQPGAFANEFFERFHRRLIANSFRRGEIQLIAVEVADKKIGYIYNFVYRNRVYNYQTGFDYSICERQNRPGLVSHASVIEYNAARGNSVYDFLAGDQEYKQALGTRRDSMSWVMLQRPRLRFRFEDSMRDLRNWLRGRRPPARPVQADKLADA